MDFKIFINSKYRHDTSGNFQGAYTLRMTTYLQHYPTRDPARKEQVLITTWKDFLKYFVSGNSVLRINISLIVESLRNL